MATSAHNDSQQKFYSVRGYRPNDGHEPSHSSPGPSAVIIPATPGAIETFSGSGRSVEGVGRGHVEDDELSLSYPHSVFDSTWGSQPTSPEPDNPPSDVTNPNSRYYSDVASLSSLLSLRQSFATSSTSINSSLSDNSVWAWSSTAALPTSASCSACRQPMSGQFVRALGTVFHLDCFRCGDCNIIVASKFFPIEGSNGKQQPLCEKDYFKRLKPVKDDELLFELWNLSFPDGSEPGSGLQDSRSNDSRSDGTQPTSQYDISITPSNSLDAATLSVLSKPSPLGADSSPSKAVSGTAICAACQEAMSGQFVRALGTVFHLDCFRCGDCNTVVASKFFPIEEPDGKRQPLCQRDYFRRLNLICAKCEQALQGSYITACNKKFHIEHFTCSVCPTLFSAQDSYYEHNGDVYCHFHYSTRYATKCVGCGCAILKQFVEINRNMKEECWHPECHMIHKFWNVKLASRPTSSFAYFDSEAYAQEEAEYNAITLKEKQTQMETLAYRIWTHLAAFEESSAACISDMLRHVSNGIYLDAIRMAEKFILHIEVLFAVIDELEAAFTRADAKGISHKREAQMLCRKIVDFFTLLSHTQDSSSSTNPSQVQSRRMGMTQELLALVTGLAHYLKIIIRIALTGALKLEYEHSNRDALLKFLDRLQCLGMDGANPNAKRQQHVEIAKLSEQTTVDRSDDVAYGYRSLGPECAGASPFSPKAIAQEIQTGTSSLLVPPSDLCTACKLTVEEDCVHLGTYKRWHSHCVKCVTCGEVAAVALPVAETTAAPSEATANGNSPDDKKPSKTSSARRPPANVDNFRYKQIAGKLGSSSNKIPSPSVVFYCVAHSASDCHSGLNAASRLEQYAFLLNVALRRLYLLLRKRGVLHLTTASTPSSTDSDSPAHSSRSSAEILRMKSSVHLDRKLSATARLPKRSTIIENPTGKIAQPTKQSRPVEDVS
ncbi:hypothetical protein M407DRAFT_24822 [Tulasnella calospora MUT 4182]|uniref:LIM zinc-binding domain-containing protein n=1 Tax=Tulasnella calospora MUT 4182 TaxID=1051891 RepID=A0A0C3Q820_9AGAM|nr:hypothetical protein M407DRAFT_24822 [Tulasnella calospora MUT 4182]